MKVHVALLIIISEFVIILWKNCNWASVSEPHTSESNWDFSYIYKFSGVRRSVYSERCNLTR